MILGIIIAVQFAFIILLLNLVVDNFLEIRDLTKYIHGSHKKGLWSPGLKQTVLALRDRNEDLREEVKRLGGKDICHKEAE